MLPLNCNTLLILRCAFIIISKLFSARVQPPDDLLYVLCSGELSLRNGQTNADSVPTPVSWPG
ncbi:hypothetical protein RSAG8_04348, partial [Rhizoctonia solani AG-8 WAC10335]